MANLQLNTAPAGLTGILVPGDGATLTALSESGDWPAATTLRVQPATGAEQAIAATVAGTLATWTLTVAQVSALIGTRTTGSLEARITHGSGDLLRPVAAGRLSILSRWAGIGQPQSLGTITLGPAGPGVPAAGTAGQALLKTSGTDYATHWGTLTDTLVRFLDTNGDPLPAGSLVTIKVNTGTGDIDDITYQGA